jgi:uncharacterized protein YecT (DUF1311 family)
MPTTSMVTSTAAIALLSTASLLALHSGQARALDCAKAATDTEKAICGNAALKAADEAMGAAYAALRARLDDVRTQALTLSQRAFIAQREWCGNEALICIADRTTERIRFLTGGIEPGALIGPSPAMEPHFVQQAGDSAKGLYTVDHTVTLFSDPAQPGERAFNAALRRMADDAPLGEDPDLKDFESENPWESSLSSRITLLTPDIISAETESYSYTGGAHGMSGVSSVSYNRRTGEMLLVPDLIGADGVDALFAICREQIIAEKIERLGGYDPETPYKPEDDSNFSDQGVRDGLKEPSMWRLAPGRSTVTYNSYAVGSYAEGRYECIFANSMLNALSGGRLALP